VTCTSCFDKNSPNYQYMPNMAKSVDTNRTQEVGFLPNGMEAKKPVDNTIPRGKFAI